VWKVDWKGHTHCKRDNDITDGSFVEGFPRCFASCEANVFENDALVQAHSIVCNIAVRVGTRTLEIKHEREDLQEKPTHACCY
jgi:hypothetical protein